LVGQLAPLAMKLFPSPSFRRHRLISVQFFANTYAVWRRLRSGSAANKPFASKIRMASERDGWPGTRLRHSSMSSSQSSWSRRLTTFAQSADDRASFVFQ
jgi:hypothetical protein